jgi:hypothetical protein
MLNGAKQVIQQRLESNAFSHRGSKDTLFSKTFWFWALACVKLLFMASKNFSCATVVS